MKPGLSLRHPTNAGLNRSIPRATPATAGGSLILMVKNGQGWVGSRGV